VKTRISPTRMKLLETKKRVHVAKRGHKLLKDKLEALIRELLGLIKLFDEQEKLISNLLPGILERFLVIRSLHTDEEMDQMIHRYAAEYEITMNWKNMMNIALPSFDIKTLRSVDSMKFQGKGLSAALDEVLIDFDAIFSQLLKLAEIQYSLYEIAKMVEMTKRRVNALEYILIPELDEIIRVISSKLDEDERSNVVRLMKIKSILAKKKVQQ
jgi:V/A-type H+/Na+-transporting ATPase subunit D